MSQPERYEMLVLGSGEGGNLAWHMAKSGVAPPSSNAN